MWLNRQPLRGNLAASLSRSRGSGRAIVSGQAGLVKGRLDVRFGSLADICSATDDVRFTPESDRESRHLAPKRKSRSAAGTRYDPDPLAALAKKTKG